MTNDNRPTNPQASEVHATTADANVAPTAPGDERTTRERTGHGRSPSAKQKVHPDAGDTQLLSDESDDGGPVVFKDAPERDA